jgi:hypothetical protein
MPTQEEMTTIIILIKVENYNKIGGFKSTKKLIESKTNLKTVASSHTLKEKWNTYDKRTVICRLTSQKSMTY